MHISDNDSKSSLTKFNKRKLIVITIIISVAAIIIGMWFFFMNEHNFGSTNFLPPNCYMINGKQICPNPWNYFIFCWPNENNVESRLVGPAEFGICVPPVAIEPSILYFVIRNKNNDSKVQSNAKLLMLKITTNPSHSFVIKFYQ